MSGLLMRRARTADLPGVLEILGTYWKSEAKEAEDNVEVGVCKWRLRLRELEEDSQEHRSRPLAWCIDGQSVIWLRG